MKVVKSIISSICYFIGILCILAILSINDIQNISEGLRSIFLLAIIAAISIALGYIISNTRLFKCQILCSAAVVYTFFAKTFHFDSDDCRYLVNIYNRCGSYNNMYRYCMSKAYNKEGK